MNIKNFDRQRRCKVLIDDAIANIIRTRCTHEDALETLDCVYRLEDFRNMPELNRRYLYGYSDGRLEDVRYNYCVWVFRIGEHLLTSERMRSLEEYERVSRIDQFADYKKPLFRVVNDMSRYVWMDEYRQPLLDKPYLRKFLKPECENRSCYCEVKS